jgi:uncharacterized ion transporter superfamily protein YfcC
LLTERNGGLEKQRVLHLNTALLVKGRQAVAIKQFTFLIRGFLAIMSKTPAFGYAALSYNNNQYLDEASCQCHFPP